MTHARAVPGATSDQASGPEVGAELPTALASSGWLHAVQRRGPRFLVAGACNTVFGYSSFALLVYLAGDHVHYLLLLLVAHTINVAEAFTVYRRFVFRVSGSWLLDLMRYTSVSLTALLANVVLLPVGVEVLGIPVLLTQALVLGGTVVLSFVAHDRFSFKRQPDRKQDS